MNLGQTNNLTQLDERFRNIPPFIGLKLFGHYSKVVPWSGNEQKAMVKQLITTAPFLLIQDALETMHCTRAILDFIILAQYLLHDDKTLSHMVHALYRLDKTKIAFENHHPINAKLFHHHFNYPKFHAMTHFVKCIRDYGSAINYDTAHDEAAHKYLFKAFYGQTNKKEYQSQILKHNIRHTNVIAMQEAIQMAKVLDGSAKKKHLFIDTPDAEVTWVCSATNVLLKYNYYLNPTDNEAAVDLGLQSIKKYWRRAAQGADKLSHLQNFLSSLAIFVNEPCIDYDQKMQLDKRLTFRQDRDHQWMFSFFVKLHTSVQYQKIDGKDITDTSEFIKEFVRYFLV